MFYCFLCNDFYSPFSELVKGGVGVHHAGLDVNDRKLVEELFKSGKMAVLSELFSIYSYMCCFVVIDFLADWRLAAVVLDTIIKY